MNIRKNSKIWQALADSCDSPGDFIKNVMRLRDETCSTLGKKMGTTPEYISQALTNKCVPATKACFNFAKALDIDPYLLNRITSNYAMKRLIEKYELRPEK